MEEIHSTVSLSRVQGRTRSGHAGAGNDRTKIDFFRRCRTKTETACGHSPDTSIDEKTSGAAVRRQVRLCGPCGAWRFGHRTVRSARRSEAGKSVCSKRFSRGLVGRGGRAEVRGQRVRTIRAGLPTASERAGRSFVTTAPAPTMQPSPIVTPGQTIAPPPSQQSSPIVIGRPHSRCVARSAASNGWWAVSSCTLGPMSVRRPMRIGARSMHTQPKLMKVPAPAETL